MPWIDKREKLFAFPCESHKKSCLDKWMDAMYSRRKYNARIAVYTYASQVYTIFSCPAQTRTTSQRMWYKFHGECLNTQTYYEHIECACACILFSQTFCCCYRNLKVSIQFFSISNIFESALYSEIQGEECKSFRQNYLCVCSMRNDKIGKSQHKMEYPHIINTYCWDHTKIR